MFVSCTFFFFSSRRRHTRCSRDWSSDVCSSDLPASEKPTTRTRIRESREPQSCWKTKPRAPGSFHRSEEHTSELQSRLHLVCRLLLEKKKNKRKKTIESMHKSARGVS